MDTVALMFMALHYDFCARSITISVKQDFTYSDFSLESSKTDEKKGITT